MTTYHIGFDSTDSATKGMCTTYLGAMVLERLSGLPIELSGFPELVRLNPNVPWKTRGNGAVCLRYEGEPGLGDRIMSVSSDAVEELSVFEDPQTNPGLVLVENELDERLGSWYQRALHEILDVEEARDMVQELGIHSRTWKNGRGAIGALAAVGADLTAHSYEAMLYRPGSVKERERKVDIETLRNASSNHPSTFFNVDKEGEPVCIPHSPCPVILGIRGMDPGDALEALKEVSAEGYERWVLWKTNQHTDAHIESLPDLKGAGPYSSISVEITVIGLPGYIEGGHLIIPAEDGAGTRVDLAAYEPTKGFRKRLSELLPGDVVRIWGSIRQEDVPRPTVNLEKVDVLRISEQIERHNPRCSKCGGPTESMGRDQGLRCKKCGYRGSDLEPLETRLKREISRGLIEPPPDAWRHLFRPSTLPSVNEEPYEGPMWGIGHPAFEGI
ncbi:MAG: DUF1743 domain-containing protein [Thermoplasmatota archaeon]